MAANPDLRGEAFNFSNELEVTVLDVIRLILRLMHSSLEPDVRNEATNEIGYQCLNAAKAREVLRWRPMFSLEQAMGLTIEWYRQFFADEPRATAGRGKLAG